MTTMMIINIKIPSPLIIPPIIAPVEEEEEEREVLVVGGMNVAFTNAEVTVVYKWFIKREVFTCCLIACITYFTAISQVQIT